MLELYGNESLEKFREKLQDGIDEFTSHLEELNMTVKLDCEYDTVRSTHYSYDRPRYEKSKSDTVHKFTQLVPESIVKGKDVQLKRGKTWNPKKGLATKEVISSRLHDPNCPPYIREYMFLDYGESKCSAIPKPDLSNVDTPQLTTIGGSDYTGRSILLVDVPSYIHEVSLAGSVTKSYAFQNLMCKLHEEALCAKQDFGVIWDDPSQVPNEKVKTGTEYDR